MSKNKVGEERLDGVWVKDSETGREFLLDYKTGNKLLERINGKIVEVKDDAS